MKFIFIFTVLTQFYSQTSDCAVYTALTRLRDLALMENTLIQSLHDFISTEKSILEQVMTIAEQVENSLGKRKLNDPDKIYSNPLEVYTLFKRFVYQWGKLESIIVTNKSNGLFYFYIYSCLHQRPSVV